MEGSWSVALLSSWKEHFRRRRKVRPELKELAALVEEISRWQRGLALLFVIVVLIAGKRLVPATDPVQGPRALLEALACLLFAGQLIVDGTRLAHAPRRSALRLALSGTGFGLWCYLWHEEPLPLFMTIGLWTLSLRAGSLERLLAAHPQTFSARRLAHLRGGSGRQGSPSASATRAAARLRQRTRRMLFVLVLVGGAGCAWALHERPEDPRRFLERYRLERNNGRADDEPEWLPASWFGTSDGASLLRRNGNSPNDPSTPDRVLTALFPLADGSATKVCCFRAREEWEMTSERTLGPELLQRLEAASAAFRRAWETGQSADFEALGALDPAPGRRAWVRHSEEAPERRPPLGPHVFEVLWTLDVLYPCGDRWLRSSWTESNGRLELLAAR